MPFSIKSIDGRGKSLVATRDINAGELIMVDCPVTWIAKISDESQGSFCYNCGSHFNKETYAYSTCTHECGCTFCSDRCRDIEMSINGHLWLCNSIQKRVLETSCSSIFNDQVFLYCLQYLFILLHG